MSTHRYVLRDVPNDERPRERMLKFGAQALSNAELLAIIIRTGTLSESAIHLSHKILNQCGGLRQLADLSVDQLMELKGIGPAKAVQLLASLELGRRLSRSSLDHKIVIRSPEDAAAYVMEDLRYEQREHFVCLFLNTKNHVIGHETLSIGSLNASIVHPREVFRAAIKKSSASIICVHNHPSGDPTPSPQDLDVTKRLVEAGELIGIDVLDHIIIGDTSFLSMKQKGYM